MDEMVACHHQLNGYEFEQTLGDSEGQGSLVCCSLWDHKESDPTEQLNNKLSQRFTYLRKQQQKWLSNHSGTGCIFFSMKKPAEVSEN